ncbi:alpha/beta hydrolase [Dyadobacter luteus]|jgi:pimeloyl-ACP methyl ester carboxylesterase|uniref:Alpha/beta hydrolase n=1 Tax=Dyadobacter luteus TaxID=2259619 RepID=A0A3D8YG39_9BACT|nr:alpha/beta hydrolase [Dyadobacter luteus]REA63652.1 alpha/beta hydrolase [Dyadobacter luteus]
MKTAIFIAISFLIGTASFGQKNQPRTYLFVPGAWDGGWDYAKVDSILSSQGQIVYRPTLTGIGEREHLANANVNLTTYITDIVNVIKFENLRNVILVGHSFGGMVISGVAEVVPDRLSQLVYLDAMVPNDGESAKDVTGELWDQLMVSSIKDSVMLYPFGASTSAYPRDVPQPIKTFTEPLKISNPLAKNIPAVYISMTQNGKPGNQKMGYDRAKERNWKIFTLEGGHYAMREQPENMVRKLEEALKDNDK